jgi:hypothetical protein
MTVAYGTILDCKFAPQALALYRSYEQYVPQGTFYFFAMDEAAAFTLEGLNLGRAAIVRGAEIADPDLMAQKSARTFAEYCWASKPLAIRYMLDTDKTSEWACYLDSDMAFFGNPEAVMLAAANGGFGLFTPHRFGLAMRDWPEKVGHHNGGFAMFRRTADAERVLERWFRDCLARPDKAARHGQTFDQMIIDQIVTDEPEVKSLQHPGINLAPWNFDNYHISDDRGHLEVDGEQVFIYHFQSLRMHSIRLFTLYNSNKRIAGSLRRSIYRPYLVLLRRALRDLRESDPHYRPFTYPMATNWMNLGRVLLEAATGRRSIAAFW